MQTALRSTHTIDLVYELTLKQSNFASLVESGDYRHRIEM